MSSLLEHLDVLAVGKVVVKGEIHGYDDASVDVVIDDVVTLVPEDIKVLEQEVIDQLFSCLITIDVGLTLVYVLGSVRGVVIYDVTVEQKLEDDGALLDDNKMVF